MNPLPSDNSLNAARGDATPVSEHDFDLNYASEAFCDFADWFDSELAELEVRFAKYITSRSQKRSFGR